jgi:hypothetical protein
MLTSLTHLSAKDVHYLQPHRSRRWAERQLEAARLAASSGVALLRHLASFWGLEDEDLITQLRPRFSM